MSELTIPIALFLAFTSDDVCPSCLGRLYLSEVCPSCSANLAPVFDYLEKLEAENRLPRELTAAQ